MKLMVSRMTDCWSSIRAKIRTRKLIRLHSNPCKQTRQFGVGGGLHCKGLLLRERKAAPKAGAWFFTGGGGGGGGGGG